MIGERLASILQQKNMRAGTLATRTGIPKATIYSILRRNSKNVDYEVLCRIAKELDVPVGFFLDENFRSENALETSPAERIEEEFISLFMQLTKEQKQFIIEAMKGLLHQL